MTTLTGGKVLKGYEDGKFRRVHFAGEIDILMNQQGSEAFVIWPRWADDQAIRAAMQHAHSMGFTDIIETGNYGEHRIDEVECDDWDYVLVVGK